MHMVKRYETVSCLTSYITGMNNIWINSIIRACRQQIQDVDKIKVLKGLK